ncbi:hypothetical protein [Pontibacter anaerobius]|uniref:Lipoprotein n=1 Tax=Pontibacter anaerobius TaxID=2993940 RepID=A0ABT3RCL9_9BACT|nr:hypothetical protein [Pontibacter anaerobius]MCX2739102.1 hypothetical protein [Pontibacter anaerobius]
MYKCKHILIAIAIPLLLSACNGQDAEKAAENEQALTEYRDYVTSFETDSLSEVEMRALQQSADDSTAWETEKAKLQEMYDERRERVEKNLEELTSEQQAEAQQLEQRYNNALATREQQYRDASHRYRLRRDLLGLEIKEDDLSDVTAANIGATYDRFVTNLQQNAEKYKDRDWELIEGWWSALNSRYRTLEGKLQSGTKKIVQQAQNQYKEIRPKVDINGNEE